MFFYILYAWTVLYHKHVKGKVKYVGTYHSVVVQSKNISCFGCFVVLFWGWLWVSRKMNLRNKSYCNHFVTPSLGSQTYIGTYYGLSLSENPTDQSTTDRSKDKYNTYMKVVETHCTYLGLFRFIRFTCFLLSLHCSQFSWFLYPATK